MSVEAVQQVVAVLPHRFYDHERRVPRDVAEDFHAALLGVDEAVVFLRIDFVAANDFASPSRDGGGDGLLGLELSGPACLVGRNTKIAIRD